jgi:4-hydroxybenzoate polyprenyltransferase/geranylgeranylglycerol-phosphate geranylgeranyltransferase
MMGWAAGLYLSDFLDRKLDAIEKPHRPIPSGRIRPDEGLAIGGILAISGGVLSFYISLNSFLLVFVVAILVYSYANLMKSRGIFGNINRGLVTVTAYLFGVFSTGQSISDYPLYIFLLAFVFLIHDTNSNLVGAIRDIKGDEEGGYITIPVKYGLKNSIFISLFLTILWEGLLLFLPFYFSFLSLQFYLIMLIDIGIIICLYYYLFQSIQSYSREKALHFHEFFVIERVILASALIFGIVDYILGSIICILALIITSVSQRILRKRYEFRV